MADVMGPAAFRIDLDNLCVWRRDAAGVDERLNLTPKTFDVLRYLVENPRRLVSHEELLDAVWPDVHVQPEVLKSHILAIRNALGDKSSHPRFIETQRGRGYRFIGNIGSSAPSARTKAPDDLGVFVGRAEPLHELASLLKRATSGEPQAVFISGEPGIGKTTLVEQFLSHSSGHPDLVVAQGHCIEGFAGVEPYYPVLEALRDLCKGPEHTRVVRALVEQAPSWAMQFPGVLSSAQQVELLQAGPDARSRMIREGCNLFEALAAERPLVLVLEDLHWADFATIDFISALCRRRSSAKLMLIGTYRSEGLASSRHPLERATHDLALHNFATEIALSTLSTTAVSELLTGAAQGQQVPAEFIRFLNERTGGHPMFIRVTLDYLLKRGQVSRTEHGWRLNAPVSTLASETPPTLARGIELKIEGLDEDHRRVLEAASVAGLRFDPASTARAAAMDEQSFEAICEELSRDACLIHRDTLLTLPDGKVTRAYAFNHAMFRQVVYDRIGESRRANLHRIIAERLEEIYPPDRRSEVAVQLAQHFAAAWEWPRALDYLRSALRVATLRFARRDTLAILDRAAEIAVHLPAETRITTEIDLLERRGAIESATHDPIAKETLSLLAEKARDHGDIDTQCRALTGLAYVTSWHDIRHSTEILDQVLALSDKMPDPIERDITRITAFARRLWASGWNRADARECEDALARLKGSADTVTLARAQISFSMVCVVSTRYRETLDLIRKSYRLLRECPDSSTEMALARAVWMHHVGIPWSLFSLGEIGAALAEFNTSIAGLRESGDLSTALSFQGYRGIVRFHALDFEGVLRDCMPITSQPSQSDSDTQVLPVVRRIALVFSGLAELGLGNNVAALKHLRTTESEMESEPAHLDWYWRLPLEWGMVGVLISKGDRAAALARAKCLCGLAAQTDEHTWQALAWESYARAAQFSGKAADAIDHITNALAACEKVEVPIAEWRVHTTAAMIHKAGGDKRREKMHSQLGAAARERLAQGLSNDDRLRSNFERRSELALAVEERAAVADRRPHTA